MTLDDAKNEAEHRKQLLEESLRQSVSLYQFQAKELVGAIDALIQARIKENYHGD